MIKQALTCSLAWKCKLHGNVNFSLLRDCDNRQTTQITRATDGHEETDQTDKGLMETDQTDKGLIRKKVTHPIKCLTYDVALK